MRKNVATAIWAAVLAASCVSPSDGTRASQLIYQGADNDPGRAEVEADVAAGQTRVEAFFGERFSQPVRVVVSANRAAFDAALPAAWQLAPTQCWMVGVGTADFLEILSPAAWTSDACEHNGADPQEVQDIITHELTHAFHGQRNSTRDFTGLDDIGWFVEGLAVLVAGQMDHGRELSAADAIAAGAAPAALANAWSGRYRYGVSGSMVAYIDAIYGRRTIVALLGATTQQQILRRLHLSEAQFLERWRAWVTRHGARPR